MKHHLSRLVAGAVCAALAFSVHAADEQDAVGRFEITRFAVNGNTLLTPQDIDKILKPFTGKERNFGDVQMALEALEAAYQQRGFNVVQVVLPEQELNQGVVTLRVVETKVGKVRIEGNQSFDDTNIRRSVPA
ncbi:MAG: POTRA domain-containing protein, partial [Noviherbaspirillum sp.]